VEINFSSCIPITDESSVGEARRTGLLAAQRIGLDEVKAGQFALLATEVCRNVLRHGGGGEAIITAHNNGDGPVGRIVALDRGSGIKDITKALDDGYSTGGTLGMGLGSMKRIARRFEIFTAQTGTIVFLEIGEKSVNQVEIAGLAVPYPGERVCGDAWAYHRTSDRTLIFLADGLGHGIQAADAANEAVKLFRKHAERAPAAILSYVHDGLKKTRGAAAAVTEIVHSAQSLTYAGVGNTAAVILSKRASRSLVSHNGTLGMLAPKFQEFHVPWPEDGILIMHSDGLQTKWDLSAYPGMLARHAAVIGGALLRDFKRMRDDASVVVAKAVAQKS
jgi:anti-sigma regulatory factor (Ser/Thr protein kinase)